VVIALRFPLLAKYGLSWFGAMGQNPTNDSGQSGLSFDAIWDNNAESLVADAKIWHTVKR
jgi:hypothetical protein